MQTPLSDTTVLAIGTCVEVDAPARLHLGFVDLHGGLGRRFASIGMAISDLATVVRATHAEAITTEGPGAERAEAHARRVLEQAGISSGVRIGIERAIPEHAGLGSGTQLALAVGTAVAALHGLRLEPAEIAFGAQRGARSGVGIGVFERGGFVLDGGRGRATRVPPVLSRMPFPDAWRALLVFDERRSGLHGARESVAFAQLQSMPAPVAADIARTVVMQLLPALAEHDFDAFATAVGSIQRGVGAHFAGPQGGWIASPDVAEVVHWLMARGFAGVGQSSWGPTGFAFLRSEAEAQGLAAQARERWHAAPHLRFHVCRGRNEGARIDVTAAVPPAHAALARIPRGGR